MAIVIRDKTACSLCGKTISRSDEVIAFSPFVINEADDLHRFSDAAFHADCFRGDPLSSECLAVYEECREQLKPGRRECAICGNQILDPDDHFTVGYLTRNSESPQGPFNFYQAHQSCLQGSDEAVELYDALAEARLRDELAGPGVDRLLQLIETLLPSRQPG